MEETGDTEEMNKARDLGANLRTKCFDVLYEEVMDVCSELVKEMEAQDQATPPRAQQDDQGSGDALDVLQELRRKRMKVTVQDEATDEGPVKAQLNRFFTQEFDVLTFMAETQSNKVSKEVISTLGTQTFQWVANLDKIMQLFDVREYWEKKGKREFPLVYGCAARILALPDSNAALERTFSAATWMDGKLKSHQKDMTFQMKVLTYKNREFVAEMRRRGFIQEERLALAKNRAKTLMQQAKQSAEEEDTDQDLNDAVDVLEGRPVEDYEEEESDEDSDE